MSLSGRVALLTGAAGDGIGRSVAMTLSQRGARIAVNYRKSEEQAQRIVEWARQHGGQAAAVQADITQRGDCEAMVRRVEAELGPIDMCVVNPGGGWHAESIDRLDPEAALQDLRQEASPIYYLMPLLLPGMYERKWGRFIAIALDPSFGSPAYAYNVAKTARSYAMRLAERPAWKKGVTFNVIGPGPVAAVESFDLAASLARNEAAWDNRSSVTPQDIAEGVAFLCSESGRYITGNHLKYVH